MGARVRAKGKEDLEVVGHGALDSLGSIAPFRDAPRGVDEQALLLGTREGVGPASLSSLRRALLDWRRRVEWAAPSCPVNVALAPAPEEGFSAVEYDYFGEGPSSIVLMLKDDRLLVRVQGSADSPSDLAATRRLLAPLLRRHRASLQVTVEESGALAVDWPIRGRTVADALRLAEEIEALLSTAEGGEITRAGVLDLLAAGRWDLLVGQPESDWLEAKGAPYDHLGPNWRYELAKDVAAFANAPEGGLIVIGMTTTDRGEGDTITGLKEFELDRVRRQAYRNHVAQRVYPRVEGFEVRRFPGRRKGWGLAALVVPPQPETSHPFLVQGVVSRGEVLGAHVLVPTRREDDTSLMDAGAIHARLRLGEQAIRGGPTPD